MEPVLFLFFLFVAAAMLAVASKTIRVVPQATVIIVERLGRFHKLADSGLHVLVPFIDRPRDVHWSGTLPALSSIDLREQFLDMPLQSAITRDNVQIVVDAVVYWQITDPLRSVYEVVDLVGGIIQLTITGMRGVIGDMDLDQCLSSREEMANIRPEDAMLLERTMLELPTEERELITLRHLDGLTYQELAERLAVPQGTIMSPSSFELAASSSSTSQLRNLVSIWNPVNIYPISAVGNKNGKKRPKS